MNYAKYNFKICSDMAKLQVATRNRIAIYSYLARIYDVKHRVVYLHLQGGGLKHNQEHRAMIA